MSLWVEDDSVQRRMRAQRAAREAVVVSEKRRGHNRSAPFFFDNIDGSAGIDACHPWTGQTTWNHTNGQHKAYEHGVFRFDGCHSEIATRVMCYATFGHEVPRTYDVTPLCGDHMCMNIKHFCIAPHGGVDKLKQAVTAEEFFREGAGLGSK